MGKASRRKKERVKGGVAETEAVEETSGGSAILRNLMLWGIPLLAAGLVYGGLEAENNLFAGVAGLGGAGLWIVLLLSDLGKTIPPSGRNSGASIDFGTR